MIARMKGLAGCLLLAALAPLGCQRADGPEAAATQPIITTKSGIEMILLPAGSFEMGSQHGPEEEKPVHRV